MLVIATLANAADTRLDTAKETYLKQLGLIQSGSAGGTTVATDRSSAYRSELLELKINLQKAGDLDGLLAAQDEIQRFEISLELPNESIVSAHPQIAALQKKYLKLDSHIDTKKSEAIVSLTDQYIAHLERLKKELTISGDVTSAISAKDEIELVSASEIVASARKAVALKTNKPPPAKIATANVQSVEKPADESAKQASAPPGYVVYKVGETPPQQLGTAFARLALSDTGNTPLAKKLVSVVASREAGQATKASVVRLMVRHTNTASVLKDQILNIKFFSKATGTDNRISPRLIGSGSIKIPELTSAGIYIDCPASSSSQTTYTGWQPGGPTASEFYGIIVNVYNADGSLSYQGISASGLKEQAAANITRSKEDARAEEIAELRANYERARSAYYASPADPALRAAYDTARQSLYSLSSPYPVNP